MLTQLALFLSLPLMLVSGGTDDPVVVIRAHHSVKNSPVSIGVYQAAGAVADSLGEPVSSDLSFGSTAGKKRVLWSFLADWNGDGLDEIIRVDNKKKKGKWDLGLKVYDPPLFLNGSTGGALATTKKKSLGKADGTTPVTLIGAVDYDADGKDEAFLIVNQEDGTQTLEIRRFPKKKKKAMGGVLASDLNFGHSLFSPVVFGCGADVDGDGSQELVVIVRPLAGADQLLVFNPPTVVGGGTGSAIASDLDITPSDLATTMGLGRMDRDADGKDELGFVRLSPSGKLRLDVQEAPGTVDGTLGAVLFTDPTLVAQGANITAVSVGGLRGYQATPPPLPSDISGTYTSSFSHLANGSPETLPSLGNLIANMAGSSTFAIMFPAFNQSSGSYDKTAGTIIFGSTTEIDVVSTGSTYELDLGIASVTMKNGKVIIEGTYDGIKEPPIGPDEAVTNGAFTLTQQ